MTQCSPTQQSMRLNNCKTRTPAQDSTERSSAAISSLSLSSPLPARYSVLSASLLLALANSPFLTTRSSVPLLGFFPLRNFFFLSLLFQVHKLWRNRDLADEVKGGLGFCFFLVRFCYFVPWFLIF